jgi:pimeloyl-ACP methyl ester carboxylesterase
MTTQSATDEATAAFRDAQQRVLDRYQVPAQSRFVEVPSISGRAQVLVTGEGPALPMVIGGAIPAVFWAPLMAELSGHTLYAIELPGNGLTDRARYHHTTFRRTAVAYLADILDALDIGPVPFVTQSMGSLWTTWLAWEQPGRVRSQVMIACPAFFLDTSAILPWRLVSIPALGNQLVSLRKPSVKGAEQIIRMVGEDPAGLDEIRDVMVAGQRMPHRRQDLAKLMRSVMSWTRPRPEVAVTTALLRTITHPVRLIWGEEDGFGSPEAGRRAVEYMPDADLHVMPGGHAPWLHRAGQVAALTHEFLDTH